VSRYTHIDTVHTYLHTHVPVVPEDFQNSTVSFVPQGEAV